MPISVRLSESLEKRLTNLAKLTGRTKAYYLRLAIEEKLDDLEDIYLAEHRLDKQEGRKWTLTVLGREDDMAS